MSFNASLRGAAAIVALAAVSAAAQAQTPSAQTSQDQLNQLTPAQAAQVKAIVEQMLAEKQAALPAPIVDQLAPPPAPTVATSWSGG